MFDTRQKWTLARLLTFSMAMLALFFFAFIVITMVVNSIPAVTQFGLGNLFSTKISTVFSATYTPGEYGLLTGIWGTVLAGAVALAIAFPVALAMAVLVTEFNLGGFGKVLEVLISIFSGIPPVVYGLLSIFVAIFFIRPKFAGADLTEQAIRALPGLPPINGGTLPTNQSTLLGGMLLSLLIIPFMTPLILDAIRNVPNRLKEASLALGATRWYTLVRVVLPSAMGGIIASVSLGLLKATGDVIISAWAIGFIKDNGMPIPLWDIFERNAPLTATAAGVLNAFQAGGNISGYEGSVAYFAALLLIIFAFIILGLASLLQKRLQRRFAQ